MKWMAHLAEATGAVLERELEDEVSPHTQEAVVFHARNSVLVLAAEDEVDRLEASDAADNPEAGEEAEIAENDHSFEEEDILAVGGGSPAAAEADGAVLGAAVAAGPGPAVYARLAAEPHRGSAARTKGRQPTLGRTKTRWMLKVARTRY
ncbi:hypothetical protein BD626DRAFT_634390 [Schizophyllum amplum]|uniref:Uncharacterized protein n=1 Tax=Schizophyllum amplum TaxID=97359 RepID=A0A550BZP0_9AGAR|nr:hypothetical protein BD626DRAFT_634390 [Auriculariopsis ampla]